MMADTVERLTCRQLPGRFPPCVEYGRRRPDVLPEVQSIAPVLVRAVAEVIVMVINIFVVVVVVVRSVRVR